MRKEFIITRLAKSVFFFGIYIILAGLFLLVFPGILLNLAGIDMGGPTNIVVRILGMTLVFYGYYYTRAGIVGEKMIDFFKWTIHTRMSAIVFLLVFVLLKLAPPVVLTFGAIEFLGATWTLSELLISKKKKKI
ncbi:MAG: hypothetical protein RBR58_01075 [Candidatus Humimicrobiaceae bacterium]|nr:hypothetical protein [Candidatus Humimicrobiaceae bacterium]